MNKPIFYSNHARELKGSVGNKIRILIKNGLIEYNKEKKAYIVYPIKGYNVSTYEVKYNKPFKFECNCCGWQMKYKKFKNNPTAPMPNCAHVGAIYEYLARQHKSRREDRIEQACLNMF